VPSQGQSITFHETHFVLVRVYAFASDWRDFLLELLSVFTTIVLVHCPPSSPHLTHITSSQSQARLSPSITPSTFYSRLKTHLFHRSFIWSAFTIWIRTGLVFLLADRTNGRAYTTVLRPSVRLSVVCNVCIVAKRCVLPKICLKNQIGNCLWGIEWSRERWCQVVTPILLEPSISKTAGNSFIHHSYPSEISWQPQLCNSKNSKHINGEKSCKSI